MTNANALFGNKNATNDRYCLAKQGEPYLVYLSAGGPAQLDLKDASGELRIAWFDPRSGGELQEGLVKSAKGGETIDLGKPPGDENQDWLIVVQP